jgi:hypothetical protein
LKSAFHGRAVTQVPERGGRGGKTPDFKIGNDIYVEVYCPDESNPERERVAHKLANNGENIRLAISRPVTGSAPKAVQFSTNQTIARVVGAKRKNDQTVSDCKNILWLDVKHKLQLMACNTAPIQMDTQQLTQGLKQALFIRKPSHRISGTTRSRALLMNLASSTCPTCKSSICRGSPPSASS